MMISVIERMIEVMRDSPPALLRCESWIRKIARGTGILPTSLVLQGVEKFGEHPISGGGFADIFMGSYGGNPVALKVLRVFVTDETREKVHRETIQEALLWKQLVHPYILPFLGVTHAFAPRLTLVSPWMPNGNILGYMENHPVTDRLELLAQCALGLEHLHHHCPSLVHGDIKAANILIDEMGAVRLADFGLASISESQSFATTVTAHADRGSARWMAPELLLSGATKTRSSDSYAFGMTILEVYTRLPPFQLDGYKNDVSVIMALGKGVRPSRPDAEYGIDDDLWKLTSECWADEANARPSMEVIEENLVTQLFR